MGRFDDWSRGMGRPFEFVAVAVLGGLAMAGCGSDGSMTHDAGLASCTEGSPCDGRCVSLASSPEHCGACGNACPENQACRMGECVDPCASSIACEGIDDGTCCASECCVDGAVCCWIDDVFMGFGGFACRAGGCP